MKGYKVFNPDFTCRDFQYEVGKTFHHGGDVIPCVSGFHFCVELADCFQYYRFKVKNIVCEVEASGEIIHHDDKHVTNTLTIVKQLSWHEVLDLANKGEGNSGYNNSGNHNAGNNNTGDFNSGDNNSGDYNSGSFNSGYRNSGYYNLGHDNSGTRNIGTSNSGDQNTGDFNSGDNNTGNFNTGYYNTGHYNTGVCNTANYQTGGFNTTNDNVRLFNKPSNLTQTQWWDHPAHKIMSELELVDQKDDKIIELSYTEAWANLWCGLTVEEKDVIQGIPNFDKHIFFEITGIRIN
jgi:hypothetical protein